MKVTLSNNKTYTLGFRHYYDQTVVVVEDMFTSDIHIDGHIKTIREPVITECYIKEHLEGDEYRIIGRGIACKNPKDNPNKEIARQVSLGRAISQFTEEDQNLVLEAYENR